MVLSMIPILSVFVSNWTDSIDFTFYHFTTQMQQAAADKMANFMESAMPSAPPPKPPDPPQESGCKVIPFERVG